MGYFDEYDLDSRFKSIFDSWTPRGFYHRVLDWDQRRTMAVVTAEKKDEEFIYEALEELIDDLPADVVKVKVSDHFELLSSSTAVQDDIALVPFYPSPSGFPEGLRKVRRSQLTEIDRLGVQTDHTIYKPAPGHEPKHVASKYYINEGNIAMFWQEVNCTLRIPSHPNIVPLDCLVVDSATPGGPDKVVGFTTPFIAGGTISDNVSRIFTLAHLKQLTTTIDYLNLKLGIVHGDICLWNLLIDPETDQLKIFDFNLGAKLGWEGDEDHRGNVYGHDEDRNDVKLAVFTLYEIITRDLSFREENYPHELDVTMVVEKETWDKHPNVRLEEGVEVAEYRRVLAEWVATRKEVDASFTNYQQAPDHIDWPSLSEYPLVESMGNISRQRSQWRRDLIKRGEQFIKWQRPSSRALPLPPGKRLLATGEVVNDGPEEA